MAPGLRRLVIRLISETRFPVMQSSHARRTECVHGKSNGHGRKGGRQQEPSDRHIVITTTGHQSFSSQQNMNGNHRRSNLERATPIGFSTASAIASDCKLHRWIIKERTHVTCCCRFEETGRFSSVFGVATTTTGSNACCPSLSGSLRPKLNSFTFVFVFFTFS